MKKLTLISIVLIILTSPISAQWFQNGKSPNNPKKEITRLKGEKTDPLKYSKTKGISMSKELIWKWDTIVTFDTMNICVERHIQAFDENTNLSSRKVERWTSGTWQNFSLSSFTYDANGNVSTEILSLWQGVEWLNSSKYQNIYDINDKLSSQTVQIWQNGSWEDIARSTFTYDSYGNNLTCLNETRQGTEWINEGLSTFTYDGSGNLLTFLFQMWESSSWVNQFSDLYMYDANNQMHTSTSVYWDGISWANDTKDTLIWDANGNVTTIMSKLWQVDTWEISSRVTYTHDLEGNILTTTNEFWEGSAWENIEKYTFSFDSNNSITGKHQEWKNGSWAPVMGMIPVFSDKVYVYEMNDLYRYQASFKSFPSGISAHQKNNVSLMIYPNPARGQITLEFHSLETKLEKVISIYNIQGQMTTQKTTSDDILVLDVSSYAKGMYFIKWNNGNISTMKKIVIE